MRDMHSAGTDTTRFMDHCLPPLPSGLFLLPPAAVYYPPVIVAALLFLPLLPVCTHGFQVRWLVLSSAFTAQALHGSACPVSVSSYTVLLPYLNLPANASATTKNLLPPVLRAFLWTCSFPGAYHGSCSS